jgi:hypothetical protein
LAAELRALDPTAIGTYQIEATGITVSGNSVLQAQLDTEQMQFVLAVFRGGTIPPDSSVPPSATGSPAPSSDRKGDILPDPTSSCD